MFGADEGHALFFNPARELFVLAQKTVAGVDGLGAGLLGRRNDFVGNQIGLTAGRRAQQHGFISQFHMAGVFVGLGIHGHGLDAHLAGRLDDAASDLTPVRDQNFLKHDVLSPSKTCSVG